MRRLIRYNSPVILTYSFLCVLVLLLNMLTGGWTNTHLFMVYKSPFSDPLTYIRLVGHVLGHAGWEHLINNLMYLLLIGPAMEEKYGSRNILLCILATALVTGLIQSLFFETALLGASGIVFMLIVLASFSGFDNRGIPLTLILVVILYLGSQIITGLTQQDNISQMGHIIGGISGIVCGFVLRNSGR